MNRLNLNSYKKKKNTFSILTNIETKNGRN